MYHLYHMLIVNNTVKITRTYVLHGLSHILIWKTMAFLGVQIQKKTLPFTILKKVSKYLKKDSLTLVLVFVPYCSSDWHSGTRNASSLTQNFYFHGHYIVTAVVQDLIKNTWITEAEQVVLIGCSAGAIGTEVNCDYFADELHRINADIDVKCISDSGSMYPYNTHSDLCYPDLLEFSSFEIWNSVLDKSCLEENPLGYNCIR